MYFLSSVAAGLAFLAFHKIIQWVRGTLRPEGFAPGPRVLPGLGNLLDIPLEKPYLQFHKWAKEYGEAVGLKAGTGNLVILNSPSLVYELFDKRGAICSDRPDSYILSKHVAYGPEEKQIAILQYDDYYKRWRKSLQYVLSNAGIKRVLPLLEAEACSLSNKLLHGGDQDYVQHVQYRAFAVPLVMTVGERLKDMDPGYIRDFFHSQEEILKLAIPGVAPPVDIFPIMKYIPEFFASWKTHARYVRKIIVGDADRFRQAGEKQFRIIQNDSSAVSFHSLLAKILLDQEQSHDAANHFTSTELGFAGQGLVAAATDTSAATIKNLLLAFAAYPQVLAKVQEEVDRVGKGAPPTQEQIGDLRYIKACISEIIRWRPTTPSAFPHVLTKGETVGGYYYPKDTTFIANVWSINHNETDYDRPDEFIPERFMRNPFGMLRSAEASGEMQSGRKALYAFGSGRRQCPGENFAFSAIGLTVAKLVWAYDVVAPEGGVDVSIETGFKDGLVTEPVKPNVLFRLRNADRETGIKADLQRAEALAESVLG